MYLTVEFLCEYFIILSLNWIPYNFTCFHLSQSKTFFFFNISMLLSNNAFCDDEMSYYVQYIDVAIGFEMCLI